MTGIIFTAGIYLLVIYLVYMAFLQPIEGLPVKKSESQSYLAVSMLILFGLIIRIIIAAAYRGHNTDMNCFIGWSNMLADNGISAFYNSESFTDYPPGYMYILYVIGHIYKHISSYAIIKLPAVICDCVLSFIVYKKASERFSDTIALVFAAFALFSPAVLVNSSFWGQVDSVFTVFAVLMTLCVMEKKMIAAYFLFAAGIFIKPQTFILTPVLIYGIAEHIFMAKQGANVIMKNLFFGICAILGIVLLSLPFGLENVFHQYIVTFKSYPYMTINAFNLWGAMGQNWKEISNAASVMSNIFMVCVVLSTLPVFLKSKSKEKYLLIASMLSVGAFMLMTKMHERYAYPALFMLLLLLIYRVDKFTFVLYSSISTMQFLNIAFTLFVYETDTGKYYKSPFIVVCSIINIAVYAYMIYYAKRFTEVKAVANTTVKQKKKNASDNRTSSKPAAQGVFEKTRPLAPITKIDIAIMAVVTAVYAGIALYNLGDMQAPESGMQADGIKLELAEETKLSEFKFFVGGKHLEKERPIKLEFVGEDGKVRTSKTIENGSVYAWHEEPLNNIATKYINISCEDEKYSFKELAFKNSSGEYVTPINADRYYELFDEQSLVPEKISYRNSTYFDEIYHARTAKEFIDHESVYEWTHPPLGKVIISIGIRIFGMNPFGWRIAGTIFGIIMVPIIYIMVKRMCGYTWLAFVGCMLLTFDFMHFAQTRIATIDVYVTFFIMLMYYYMFKYYNMSFYDMPLKKTLVPLGISGVFMGIGIACKWTGIYAGAGLAVIFFITLFKRRKEYEYALNNPKGSTDGISHKNVINSFKHNTLVTIGFCCIFFVLIPVIIYGLSYIPYLAAPGMEGIKSIIKNQSDMFGYHGKLVAEHSFASPWYTWPVMYRPIFYYAGDAANGLKEGISSFGNPAVWWIGIPAFFYQVYTAVKYRDKTSLFLLIGYGAQLLPWVPVTRITFIYHYFPSVPFVVLMIAYSIYRLYKSCPPSNKIINIKNIAIAYAFAVLAMFAMFYPVLSGMSIDPNYVRDALKWFDSWVLI